MPWQPQDAKRHNKGLSSGSATKWSRIANSVLAKPGYSEASAIRIANSAVKKSAINRRLRNITGSKYKENKNG